MKERQVTEMQRNISNDDKTISNRTFAAVATIGLAVVIYVLFFLASPAQEARKPSLGTDQSVPSESKAKQF